ncbi:hypothetical protein OIE62_37745 [Streptomyces scopuliridis]|uniref:Uncharacterized protein n=1 Tax=Streptomyces scopuliridis TaxID=452529 RepID=A0ACD4ZD60_9ACTN|nr:hypothetical protein [Streptomyces scopuliridis]WSB96094.1 hypothetical protein OG835_03180 [Streptomyces scopuliridis]WSC10200.1 hypothetical protein OIE62_37745 [Streptomyces scopuliridis]
MLSPRERGAAARARLPAAAKATLYSAFGKKDGPVRASLQARRVAREIGARELWDRSEQPLAPKLD